jgi:hypothetical protein
MQKSALFLSFSRNPDSWLALNHHGMAAVLCMEKWYSNQWTLVVLSLIQLSNFPPETDKPSE